MTSEYGHGGTDNKEVQGFVRPWEECRGMGESFGYNRNENLDSYQTGEQLVHQLIDIVARGGNLLLNIGPTADGRIPVIMQQRLHEIGSWLKINGEAIYGTRKWDKAPKYTKDSQVFFTQKANTLYAINRHWKDEIVIENVSKPSKVSLLGFKGDVKFSYKGNVLRITAPAVTPNTIPCQYAWTYEIK